MSIRTKKWWRDRFVTLMVIPERTRRVHRITVPFFLLKMGIVCGSLALVFLVLIGMDYIHVLGRIAENKRLKGENFKLRQEMQVIKNKVDTMEVTLERIRNYAKKLQILTGQAEKGDGGELPTGPIEEEFKAPSGRNFEKRSQNRIPASLEPRSTHLAQLPLDSRVEKLQNISQTAETSLSKLQGFLLSRRAIATATPSLLPIPGWISSQFGYRRHPYDGLYRFHSGVDIVAEPGTPVRAPAPGLVVFSGYREGYGKIVVLNHGYGITTLFAHNSKLFVQPGLRIKRGETIAEVGSTGHATGPHLHYEVRKDGMPVDPVSFLKIRF